MAFVIDSGANWFIKSFLKTGPIWTGETERALKYNTQAEAQTAIDSNKTLIRRAIRKNIKIREI